MGPTLDAPMGEEGLVDLTIGPLLGTQIGSVVLRVVDGPAVNIVDPGVKTYQVRNTTDNWFREQWAQHVFGYELSQDAAEWLIDNL